ncbi:hypothetical protein ABTX24_18890 [Nocardioides sp. NPDC127514]|uniref:hypothetical protein n=1 Tax=unclassified Nocardioides TaxID=2615069 RepID=UPI00332A8015
MAQDRTASPLLGWSTLVLLLAAAISFVVPVTLFAFASADDGVAVADAPVTVEAPAHRTWGIYTDDADNSGYSAFCSVNDSAGRPVEFRDPGATVSASETEMLDHEFTTPEDGTFTVECQADNASVRVGPVGNLPSVLIGTLIAAGLGLTGIALGVLWLTRRGSVYTPTPAA